MYALEQKIDASGQGLFVWADSTRIVPLAQDRRWIAQGLQQAGSRRIACVAFGFGTASQQGSPGASVRGCRQRPQGTAIPCGRQ